MVVARAVADTAMGDQLFRVADATTRLRTLTHGTGIVAGAFLVGVLLTVLAVALFQVVGVSIDPLPPEVNAVATALQFVGFLAVGAWYLRRTGNRDLLSYGRPSISDLGWVVVGLVGLVALFVAVNEVLARLGVEVASNAAVSQGREQPRLLLYFVVVSLLFVAPGEELIFRGLVQGLVRRAYGVVPAVVLTALVFGLVHWIALMGTGSRVAYLAIAAALGLVLGVVYEWSENLVVPILVHGCWNAGQFLLVYGAEMGYLDVGL